MPASYLSALALSPILSTRGFGLFNGYWLRAQAAYDTEVAERDLGPLLEKIKPWSVYAAKQSAAANARASPD